jgi:hypothetical protein
MKRKRLTETPMCPRERFVIISTQPACPLLKKGLGHLLQLLLLSFIYSHFIYLHYQIPLKTYLLVFTVKPWSKPLINTFCSSLDLTLLFIESTTIHPLYLWVIKYIFCTYPFIVFIHLILMFATRFRTLFTFFLSPLTEFHKFYKIDKTSMKKFKNVGRTQSLVIKII